MDGAEEEEKSKEYMSESGKSEMNADVDVPWSSYTFQDGRSTRSFDSQLFRTIRKDKKDLFVQMIKHLGRFPGVQLDYCADPFDLMFKYDSGGCMQAVVDGETAGILELDADAIPYYAKNKKMQLVPAKNKKVQLVPVLHKAAAHCATRVAKVCLPGNEAQLNLRMDVDDMRGVLPLHLALDRLLWFAECSIGLPECILYPSPDEPQRLACELIFYFAQSKLWQFPADAADLVRLLAPKTAELESEFSKYLEKRKLPELTALLMLARDSLLPCLPKTQDFVFNQTEALKRSPIFMSADPDKFMFEWAEKKKMEMEAMLLMLEIFNTIGDKIETYILQTNKDISKIDFVRGLSQLLKEAGFDAERERTNISDKDTPINNRVKESNIEFNQPSAPGLVHKQNLTATLNFKPTFNSPLGFSRTYHFVSGPRHFSSTPANKDGSFHHPCLLVGAGSGLGSTTTDEVCSMLFKLQLKKQYPDSSGMSSARQITGVCSWASHLQFKRECILSANSSRFILWITNKLGRAL